MNELVLRTDRAGVATLTLNRPDKLNALSTEMFEALDRHIDAIARDGKKIGIVILRGAAGNFSSGYDLAETTAMVKAHAKPHYQSEVIQNLADLPQPVIAAVQGQCSTGALELALAADLIVTSPAAQFSVLYARWGLTPIWGLSLRLPRRVGTSKAREMFFTCRFYSGVEAEAMGLANFCYADDAFEAQLADLSASILDNSWLANRINKRVLIATDGLPLADAHALEMFKDEGAAHDAADRLALFFERHKPKT